ncbi:hypothetical protein FHT79_006464 [Rhizobium sp. BK212]|uniref:hypothetical protein n=1 Tax=Rhizobium sp. BK212 TaxID=2587074 RepID=UPI00160C0AB3|nr:hypothetical protein [Rhizobium sp. BK212]MBB4219233.1 hypothetical protein [Rhizobium sp. BK212]
MTRASPARRKRRGQLRSADPGVLLAARLESVKSSPVPINPQKFERQMVKSAWKEAVLRAKGCLGFSVERRFSLEIVPNGGRFAEIDCTERPFKIRVSLGLPPFIYRISRILASRTYAFLDDGTTPPAADDNPPIAEAVERMHRAFFWYSAIGTSTIHQDYEIDHRQALFGSFIAFEAEIFLVCHEIAHGLTAWLAKDAPDLLAWLSMGLEGVSSSWREELVADRLALILALGKRDQRRHVHHLAMAYAGWEFAFLLHREWERYEEFETSDKLSSKTHPPARERLANLRETFRRYVGDEASHRLTSIAEALSTLFRNLVDTMFTEEFQTSAASRDQARARKLRELAIDCDEAGCPDYSRFVPAAQDIIQQGESWTLVDLVADMTAPMRREIEFDATNFGIAKLVWRATEDLPDPLYSAFKKQIRTPNLIDRSRRNMQKV